MRRTFFCVLWSVVFFIAAALVLGISAGWSAGDDPEAQRLAREASAQKYSLPAFFGSIGLAVLLTITRLLPGTRRRRSTTALAGAVPGHRDWAVPDEDAAGSQRSGYSEHRFSLTGFAQRWARTAPAAACFFVFGLVLIGLQVPGKDESVNYVGLGMAVIGLAVLVFVVARFFSVWKVSVGVDGLRWFGALGPRRRDWHQISAVYRTEKITNRRFVTRQLKLTFVGGGSVTFDQSVTDFGTLADTVQNLMANLLLPERRTELDAHGAVEFGPVTLRSDGIEMKGKFFPRTSLNRCVVENGHLVLYAGPRGRAGGDRAVPLSDVPNYLVLLELLTDKGFPLERRVLQSACA